MWVSSFGNGMKVGDISTSITETQDRNLSLEIFPNPARNELSVISYLLSVQEIAIYDLVGKQVFSQPQTSNLKPQTISINIAGLSPGIYFVKVNAEKKSATEKLVIIK
jgi:hypothetical protein